MWNNIELWFCFHLESWVRSKSLNQDIAHGFDVFIAIIRRMGSLVSTRVWVVMGTSSSKSNSGVTSYTVVFLVRNDADPCFCLAAPSTQNVEPFFIAIPL